MANYLDESVRQIKEKLVAEIEKEATNIKQDLLNRLPQTTEVQEESRRLKEKPKPTEADLSEAAKLGESANSIKIKIHSLVEGELFGLLDELIAVNSRISRLTLGKGNFILKNYLNTINLSLTGYHNSVTLDKRKIPAYQMKAKSKK